MDHANGDPPRPTPTLVPSNELGTCLTDTYGGSSHMCLPSIYKRVGLYNPVADPGFPRVGGANSPGGAPTYDFAKFPRKLHEIERIRVPGGGGGVPRGPLNPPMQPYAHFSPWFKIHLHPQYPLYTLVKYLVQLT